MTSERGQPNLALKAVVKAGLFCWRRWSVLFLYSAKRVAELSSKVASGFSEQTLSPRQMGEMIR